MKANEIFLQQDKSFWSAVRIISQKAGYTKRGEGIVKVPRFVDVEKTFRSLKLNTENLGAKANPSEYTKTLLDYFQYRANVLNNYVEPRLMDVDRAQATFEQLLTELRPSSPIPMNKQRGAKKAPAYFTSIINMLIESVIGEIECDFDPKELTTVTRDEKPLRTLSRRVDGAFPSAINPIAIWEIKEYYYTTTFGSRVADGVYETQLDGLELEELWEKENHKVRHYFMIDSHFTWWKSGRSYLCRIIDLLHMGLVDEVLFGYEVVERLPQIVSEWVDIYHTRS